MIADKPVKKKWSGSQDNVSPAISDESAAYQQQYQLLEQIEEEEEREREEEERDREEKLERERLAKEARKERERLEKVERERAKRAAKLLEGKSEGEAGSVGEGEEEVPAEGETAPLSTLPTTIDPLADVIPTITPIANAKPATRRRRELGVRHKPATHTATTPFSVPSGENLKPLIMAPVAMLALFLVLYILFF